MERAFLHLFGLERMHIEQLGREDETKGLILHILMESSVWNGTVETGYKTTYYSTDD